MHATDLRIREDPERTAEKALAVARDKLMSLQHAEGWWKGTLDTNVTMDAEDLMLREFLGIRGRGETRRAAAWIRTQQRKDGSWSHYFAGPPELSVTVEAYVALRIAGDPPDAHHMKRAAKVVRDLGGLEQTRVFTRIWMALFGQWRWEDLPAMPPEVIFLPPSCPLGIYDFACWARQTLVPLAVVGAHKPVRPLPFDLEELRTGARTPRKAQTLEAAWLEQLDRGLRVYERRPVRSVRRTALKLCAEWIVRRQEADGSWGGIQPPWVYSILALHLLGYPFEHPVMHRAVQGLEQFVLEQDGTRRLEACQSPVWDTTLATIAARDAGVPRGDPTLIRAAEWLLSKEVRVRGDWSVRRPHLEPGGWSFEFANLNYPDLDDTAEVGLALDDVDHPEPARVAAALDRATTWVLGMQCRDGGWAAFDADNVSPLPARLPFCDFGEVIDPPTADVTAHVLEMLAARGHARCAAVARGRGWLLAHQERDGSWPGRWGANHIYGTGAAVPALVAVGMDPGAEPIRRAVAWLEQCQNADGGWGEDLRSYEDASWRGRGPSTASQTAWALIALLAAGERSGSVQRGVRWLAATQRSDGSWDEPQYTGTGFPRDFYIHYGLYRLVFPVMALGRYLRKRGN